MPPTPSLRKEKTALEGALAKAWRVRQANFPPVLHASYPLDTAVISLTGTRCALDCAHCGRRYLEHMIPVGEALARVQGAQSCLISGGCDARGRVPVAEPHLEILQRLRPGRRMNWHVGLIGEEEADLIAPLVDVVSFDFVGDDATIREVYGLEATVEDYRRAYQVLRRRFRVVPHLTVGLRGGRLGHEVPALEMLARMGAEELVLLVLIPTPGTRYAACHPPTPEEAAGIFVRARELLPRAWISLGCMRPHGAYRDAVDVLAVQAGLNGIVSPSHPALEEAERRGLRILRTRECCVFDPPTNGLGETASRSG
ncbi:MAG: radical SAM protein [Anaerolineae bacterium]